MKQPEKLKWQAQKSALTRDRIVIATLECIVAYGYAGTTMARIDQPHLLHVLDRPVEEARKMLSLRFVHLNFTKTGILDYVIDLYARRVAQSPIAFKDWVVTEYDPAKADAEFKAMGFWQRLKL